MYHTLNCSLHPKEHLYSDPGWGGNHCLKCLLKGQNALMSTKDLGIHLDWSKFPKNAPHIHLTNTHT